MYDHSAAQVMSLMNAARPLPGGASWNVYKSTEHVIVSRYPLSMQRADTSPVGYRPIAMALVDLPDAQFGRDLYLMNAHYRCCGGNDPLRQMQSDALVNWMRDARASGGQIDLPLGTPMVVLGDLNIVEGPQPLQTLLDGNIINNATYGPDSPPDWDGSRNVDALPLHNGVGPQSWTWRNDLEPFAPGRLDYVIYTDSVLASPKRYVLNTVAMSDALLAATGLQRFDSILDNVGQNYDHLPVVVDFRAPYSGTSLVPARRIDGWHTTVPEPVATSGSALLLLFFARVRRAGRVTVLS
jgi:endonuclease/exonuclease/phosphatase family metal-dependent hydrolase